jgi:predicted HAD superfamily hydrolase
MDRDLAFLLLLDGTAVEQLMKAESYVESSLLRATPTLKAQVNRARRNGKRIEFMSDIYLPGTFIDQELRQRDLSQPEDVLMVSSETHQPKWNGSSYRALASRFGVDVGSIVHWGDDAESDVSAAAKAGAGPRYFTDAKSNCYEISLDGYCSATDDQSICQWRQRVVIIGTGRLGQLL